MSLMNNPESVHKPKKPLLERPLVWGAGLVTLAFGVFSAKILVGEVDERRDIAQEVLGKSLDQISTARLAEYEKAQQGSEPPTFVAHSDRRAVIADPMNNRASEPELGGESDRNLRVPGPLQRGVARLLQGNVNTQQDEKVLEEIRNRLRYPLSEEELRHRTAITAEMVDSLVDHAKLSPEQADYERAIIEGTLNYMDSKALLVAKQLNLAQSAADLEKLSPADWQVIKYELQNWDSSQHSMFGISVGPIFNSYLQYLLIGDPNTALPSWLQTGQ